jgi:hypothetical protein
MLMGLDKETVRRVFPNLTKELEGKETRIDVNSVRTETPMGEKAVSKGYSNYMPDAIDFIRRCDKQEQAEEIITYLERRGEIEKQYAAKLREQLKEKGLRSFGPKKENDYYLKHGET